MSYYRNFLENWIKSIDVKADSVLDVGGGEKPVKDRVASWNVKNYKILDYDFKFNPNILQDMNYQLAGKYRNFDIVFCLEVAEYIWSPIIFHDNLWYLLKPNGILYISYPSIYPVHQPEEIDYLRYSKKAIEKYMGLVGFEILEIIPRKATVGVEDLFMFYKNEKMHPIQKSELPFHLGYLVKAKKVLR